MSILIKSKKKEEAAAAATGTLSTAISTFSLPTLIYCPTLCDHPQIVYKMGCSKKTTEIFR